MYQILWKLVRVPRNDHAERQTLVNIVLNPGDYSGGATPVPIPNTEVKPVRADGTAWAAVWESRSLPGFFLTRIKARGARAPVRSVILLSFISVGRVRVPFMGPGRPGIPNKRDRIQGKDNI